MSAWVRLRAVAEKNIGVQQAEQLADLLACDFRKMVAESGQTYVDVLADWHNRVIKFTADFNDGVSNAVANTFVLSGAPGPSRIFLATQLAD